MKNKIKITFIIFFAVVLLSAVSPAYAKLEVNYPTIPYYNTPTANSTLSVYLSYWFGLLIYIAGIIALVSFVVGAVSLVASADNTEVASNAKDRMKGAAIGLVLTIASVLIMRTINVNLVNITDIPFPELSGVYYTDGTNLKACPQAESDVATNKPEGFNSIKYVCYADESGSSVNNPALLVWKFPKTGFEGNDSNYGGVTVSRLECGSSSIDISGSASFQMQFETPGIYYCMNGCSGSMCSGYMSGPVTVSQEVIEEPFNENISGVRIVNDTNKEIYYGAIFHQEVGLGSGGECTKPIINTSSSTCESVDSDDTRAVDIFKYNEYNPASSGNGVVFYSKPFGDLSGTNAGYINVAMTELSQKIYSDMAALKYTWTNTNVPDDYKTECETFEDCPGSIRLKGNYLVAIYSDSSASDTMGGTSSYCQTFTQDVPNLEAQPITAKGSDAGTLDSIYIIATQ